MRDFLTKEKKMKYENLIEEFDFDQHELESIANEEAVEVIDNMFNEYRLSPEEIAVLIKAVGLFEAEY